MGGTITRVIEGLDSGLESPLVDGEQSTVYLAENVYVLNYLNKTGQLTADVEQVVSEYINQG